MLLLSLKFLEVGTKIRKNKQWVCAMYNAWERKRENLMKKRSYYWPPSNCSWPTKELNYFLFQNFPFHRIMTRLNKMHNRIIILLLYNFHTPYYDGIVIYTMEPWFRCIFFCPRYNNGNKFLLYKKGCKKITQWKRVFAYKI